MKNLILAVLSTILFGIFSCCSIYERTVPQIEQNELPSSCKGLVPLVKKKWKKSKEFDYYEYDKEFLDKLQNEYKACIIGLSNEDVMRIFGQVPNAFKGKQLFYNLKKGCIGFPIDCEKLVFEIKNGSVKDVFIKETQWIEEKK